MEKVAPIQTTLYRSGSIQAAEKITYRNNFRLAPKSPWQKEKLKLSWIKEPGSEKVAGSFFRTSALYRNRSRFWVTVKSFNQFSE